MKKIPVGATIAHAYRFALTDGAMVFKAICLPLLAQIAVAVLLTRRMALLLATLQARDPSAISMFGPVLLLVALALLFFFAQLAAATEVALGRRPQSWIAFHFDRTMWRLLGGFLTAFLSIFACVLAIAILAWVASLGLGFLIKALPANRSVAAVAAGLFVVALFCGLFFLALRFLFLLAPVNVSEQQLGVTRSWKLSAGNFWRILLISLSIAIPVAVVNQAYAFLMGGSGPTLPPGASTEAREAAELAWQIARLNAMSDRWYLASPLMALMMWFQLSTGCAAQAFAYRTLVADEPDAVPPSADRP